MPQSQVGERQPAGDAAGPRAQGETADLSSPGRKRHLPEPALALIAGDLHGRPERVDRGPGVALTGDRQRRVVEKPTHDFLKDPGSMAIVENVRRCAWGDHGRVSGEVMWPVADLGDGNSHCLLSPRTGSRIVVHVDDREIKAPAVLGNRKVYPVLMNVLPLERERFRLP